MREVLSTHKPAPIKFMVITSITFKNT